VFCRGNASSKVIVGRIRALLKETPPLFFPPSLLPEARGFFLWIIDGSEALSTLPDENSPSSSRLPTPLGGKMRRPILMSPLSSARPSFRRIPESPFFSSSPPFFLHSSLAGLRTVISLRHSPVLNSNDESEGIPFFSMCLGDLLLVMLKSCEK